MSLEVWIIDELEREQDEERSRRTLDLDRCNEPEGGPARTEVRRGVRILDVSPTPENQLDL